MAACLAVLAQAEVSDEAGVAATRRVHELVTECSSLLVITMLSSPGLYKDLQHCNFDEGIVCTDTHQAAESCNILVRFNV